jgi:hypothetical protein
MDDQRVDREGSGIGRFGIRFLFWWTTVAAIFLVSWRYLASLSPDRRWAMAVATTCLAILVIRLIVSAWQLWSRK